MFTGLVREIGTVLDIAGGERAMRLTVTAPATAHAAHVGDSVAIDGCCLTVVETAGDAFSFDAVPETLARTTLGTLAPGARVNLEPALRAGEPLGGHMVQGHVDGVARVRSVDAEGDGRRLWFDPPAGLLRYLVEKGSVSLGGVSLTVAEVDDAGFAVALVPHTLAVTTMGGLQAGDPVNVEVDVLAKYVEKLLAR
jgi:riboflavin synthase